MHIHRRLIQKKINRQQVKIRRVRQEDNIFIMNPIQDNRVALTTTTNTARKVNAAMSF